MTPIARKIFKVTLGLVLLGILASLALGVVSTAGGTAVWYMTLLVGIPLAVVGLVAWLVETLVQRGGSDVAQSQTQSGKRSAGRGDSGG